MRYIECDRIVPVSVRVDSVVWFGQWLANNFVRVLCAQLKVNAFVSLFIAVSQEGADPMAVLRHYYDRLAHGVHDPMSLASKLYSMQLLSREERDQVISPQNVTPLCRAMTLLRSVEARLAAEKSAKPLLAFCRALEKMPGLCVIAEDIKKELGGHHLNLIVYCTNLCK